MRTPASEQTASFFYERWSPKVFSPQPLTEDELSALFDAARWAPSSYNEQPWRFIYSRTEKERDAIAETLVEGNRKWAGHAPHLAIVLASKHFTRNGKLNHSAEFDTGSAWMSLSLQAHLLDVRTHGMAGFHRDKVIKLAGIDAEQYEVMCIFAFGRLGNKSDAPEGVEERTDANSRKAIDEIAVRLSSLAPVETIS